MIDATHLGRQCSELFLSCPGLLELHRLLVDLLLQSRVLVLKLRHLLVQANADLHGLLGRLFQLLYLLPMVLQRPLVERGLPCALLTQLLELGL